MHRFNSGIKSSTRLVSSNTQWLSFPYSKSLSFLFPPFPYCRIELWRCHRKLLLLNPPTEKSRTQMSSPVIFFRSHQSHQPTVMSFLLSQSTLSTQTDTHVGGAPSNVLLISCHFLWEIITNTYRPRTIFSHALGVRITCIIRTRERLCCPDRLIRGATGPQRQGDISAPPLHPPSTIQPRKLLPLLICSIYIYINSEFWELSIIKINYFTVSSMKFNSGFAHILFLFLIGSLQDLCYNEGVTFASIW